MKLTSFVFERLIEEVKRQVVEAIGNGEIAVEPIKGPSIVGAAVSKVFGKPNTQEILAIMASIDNIDDYYLDNRYLDQDDSISFVLQTSFQAILDQRLRNLKNHVAVISFADGFPVAAEKLISLAEEATTMFPASKKVASGLVIEKREALERLLDKTGDRSDLQAVLASTELLRGMLAFPKDKVSWQRHGLDYATVDKATAEFKSYKEMLGVGERLIDAATAAILNGADCDVQAVSNEPSAAPNM